MMTPIEMIDTINSIEAVENAEARLYLEKYKNSETISELPSFLQNITEIPAHAFHRYLGNPL